MNEKFFLIIFIVKISAMGALFFFHTGFFLIVSLEASKFQSHDLGNTGNNAVIRIYRTKGQKTEQTEGRPRSPVLQGD